MLDDRTSKRKLGGGILDKLKDLASKLPFAKKHGPVDEDVEETEDDVEERPAAPKKSVKSSTDWRTKLEKQLPFLAKLLNRGKSQDDEEDAEAPIDADEQTDVGIPAEGSKKAKGSKTPLGQKQKVIRLLVAAGLLYMVMDSFMGDEEPTESLPEVATPAPVKKKNRKPKKKVTAEPAVEKPQEIPPIDDAAATTPPPAVETPVTTPEPTETTVTETPAPAVDVSEKTESASPAVETTETETIDTPSVIPGGEGTGSDQVVDSTTHSPDMTESILKDLEGQLKKDQAVVVDPGKYVDPPPYDFVGRGLVYNCLGKHWACIDGGSYQKCQENYAYLKGQGKPKECWPDSVYQTNTGCSWVQKQKIEGNSVTDFCR